MSTRALHNALFTAVFTNNKKLAVELLKVLLGKERATRLDFRTLKFDTAVFTDAEGNERRADAIVSVMTKEGGRVVFLIEHKSVQAKNIFTQLLSYQTILYADAMDEVVAIVVSTAKSGWRLSSRFRDSSNDICSEVTLDFGYLLLDLSGQDRETLTDLFPNSYPYLLALQSLQQLNAESIAAFFVGSLALPKEDRLRLVRQTTHSLEESAGEFSMDMLQEIEASCIEDKEDRLMHTVKLGREGWLEQGFKKGVAEGKAEGMAEGEARGMAEGEARGEARGMAEGRSEVAQRMIEEGMSLDTVSRLTGLGRADLTRLQRNQA